MSATPPGSGSRVLSLTSAQWAAAGVALGLVALLLWFAYQRGIASGGWQLAANARDRRELLNRIDALENENGKLNAKIAELEMSRRLDKQAYGQVERTLGELQSAMSRQSDDLAFYKSIARVTEFSCRRSARPNRPNRRHRCGTTSCSWWR